MKYFYSSLLIAAIFAPEFASADDYKKIYDRIADRVVEICSTDADGSVNVAVRCKYDLIDIPFIAYRADPKIKRKPTEVVEIITPVNTYRNKNSVYAIFNHALVEVTYGLANGRSSIFVQQPSDETLQKYARSSGWMVNTSDLGMAVQEVPGYKIGDRFCLNKSPDGYPDKLPVKITHLFDKDHYAVVDTEFEGFLGMGNTFKFELTDLNNLVKCADTKEKLTLDPTKIINTSAPTLNEDARINTQQAPKEKAAPALTYPGEQIGSGTSK